MQYRNSTPGHSRLDSSITRIPRILGDDDPYSEVVMISILRDDLRDVAIELSGTLDSQYLGPPPSYDSLTLESPPSYYGAIRMKLYDWMMQKQ